MGSGRSKVCLLLLCARTDSATVCAICSVDGLFLVVFSYYLLVILEPVENSQFVGETSGRNTSESSS